MRRADSLKIPWCWERLRVGGEGDNRGWNGWMASPTQWTWIWMDSRSWWWTGRPAVLRFMGPQRVDTTEWLNWTEIIRWTIVNSFFRLGEIIHEVYGRKQMSITPEFLPCLGGQGKGKVFIEDWRLFLLLSVWLLLIYRKSGPSATYPQGKGTPHEGSKHDQTSQGTLCDFKSSMIFWIVLEKNHSFLLKYLYGCKTCGKKIVVVSKNCLKQTWQSINHM